jgi:ABC-type sugar transport system ATPase subunit
MEPLLFVNNVFKRFDEVIALDNVDFELRPREIHGLAGHNGSGKTTLLKIIAGMVKADEGKITIGSSSYDLRKWNVAQAKRHSIVYVSQEQMLYPNLSILDNIYLVNYHFFSRKSLFHMVNRRELESVTEQYLDMFNLRINLDTKIKDLTPEVKELIQIIAALIVDAKILLLDEPTSPLSAEESERFLNVIREISLKREIPVVFVSHRIGEVLKVSNRITILRNGQKVTTISAENVDEKDVLKLMMGTEIGETAVGGVIRASKPTKLNEGIILRVKELTTLPRVSTEVQLKDVSFEVHEREIVGVTGLLGSGMYELGKALIGDAHIIHGEIIFMNKKVRIKSPNHANKLGILYIPEDRKIGLIYLQSIRFNVTLNDLASSKRIILNHKEEADLVKSIIKRLNIKAPSIDALITQLSGGTQQKVLISKLFAARPRLAIINEPTVGIDIHTKFEIRKIISQLPEQGISVLLISSELDDLLPIADRIIVMKNGRINGIVRPNKDEILSHL